MDKLREKISIIVKSAVQGSYAGARSDSYLMAYADGKTDAIMDLLKPADLVEATETESVSRMVHLESAGKFMVQIDCLVGALQSVTQTLAWEMHGACRGYSDGLDSVSVALAKAKVALAKAGVK